MKNLLSHRNIMVISGLLFAVALLVFLTGPDSDNDVYVCYGPRSHAFHYFEACDGLKLCTGGLSKVKVQFATDSLGRKECGYCRSMLDAIESDDETDNLRP